nr:uncharacterized protein LOC109986062 isoform X1 [Labrus bergylta]XP_020492251.1 uncharacterized protein LOC109986062 isoform X1 [Labrus bergylta]
MDDLSANKGDIPCQSWIGHNSWSTTSNQGSLLNLQPSSQHLSLGPSSDQRSSYNHLQVPNQSCMRDLSTLSSRNNTHLSTLYKAPQTNGNPSSSMLFTNTAMPNVSQIVPFHQEVPHASSRLLSANQGKSISPLSLAQRNQAQQNLSMFPPHNQYKVSFQPPTTTQGLPDGLPNGLQHFAISPASCGQRVSTSQATYDGANVEFAGVAECTHSYASSTSQEQYQWIPPSQCRETVNQSIPDAAAHPNKEQLQDGKTNPMVSNEGQRLVLLNQRDKLLQELAELDKALGSLPPEDSSDGPPPCPANQCPPSMEDSSQGEESKSSDAQQVQLSDRKAEKKECATAELEDDSNPDNPLSDDDFSEFIPDPAGFSSDDSSHSRPSSPIDVKPVLPAQESDKLESVECKTEDVTSLKEPRAFSWKKSAKAAVTPTSYCKEKRVYRRNYCLFCSKPILKMSRHLEQHHSDKPEVAVAFQYPKKSRDRLKIWKRLINQGNFAHNKVVLKTGKGQLAAKKRPNSTGQAQDFLHCLYCRGLFKSIRRHIKMCPEKVKNEDKSEGERRRTALLCVMEAADGLVITDGLKNILSVMIYDDVTRTIMDDSVLLQFGELLFSEHGSNEKKHQYVRQHLRQVARLVLEAQKISSLKKLEDFFTPSNFPHVISAVKVLAGYDPEKKTYKVPSLAVKLGYDLQKACSIVEGNAVKCGDECKAKSARDFLSVYQKKWTKLISSGALKMIRKSEFNDNKKVPFVRDVKQLNFHLEKVHEVAEKTLKDSPSEENYCALAKAILARTILFNRRGARDVSFVGLQAFMSRKKSSSQTGLDVSVSDLERAMCGYFTRIDIRGKCGRNVPIFLKQSFESALELLVECRETCGVPQKNPFLFGRPRLMTSYLGSQCLKIFVKASGAKHPEVLTLKRIRKHYAEMLQIINLDENEANQILGPNNPVQALRQDSDMQLKDVKTDFMARLHEAASQDHNEHSRACSGPSTSNQQAHGKTRGNNMTTPRQSANSDKKGSQSKQIHRTWDEAEVLAVERHMMRFIRGHKVPQKDDCVNCLEDEPDALSSRSWKGVKDYVRNRITALKRQSKSEKKKKKTD